VHIGQTCQKHPWTKTARRSAGKLRSGRPGRRLLTRYPRTPLRQSARLNATSRADSARFACMVRRAFSDEGGGRRTAELSGQAASCSEGTKLACSTNAHARCSMTSTTTAFPNWRYACVSETGM
jgi:hypothetical protein